MIKFWQAYNNFKVKGKNMLSDNEKKALQAQLEEIREYGAIDTGYYWEVFKKIDIAYMFKLLANAINYGAISKNLKRNDLMNYALDLYIDDINENDENDLRDFSNFNDCFMNFNTYTVELEKLEKNNGAEK